ncbi:fumarylacetoacetate hydrolase family protein [Roseimaritima ulvae]|uniref:Ureidoglycolate lyase n=1 Tax=Roseimaritima ulvae TaxID=980254 RepID=A0A5B9QX92_9BACT|nr:fumarylacetoacetate hydrolase family protein [Roseimaritima ulvae]QEG38573.1 Ureidoglycolate lyase [Roseimaritima ulvae]
MRFCRYQLSDQSTGIGLVVEDRIVPLQDIDPALPTDMDSLMAMQSAQLERLAAGCNLPGLSGSVKLLAPLAAPEKVVCVGLNYRDHAIETGAEIPSEPVVFNKFPSALIGPGDTIELPAESKRVDYEAELVVVIGKTARHVSEDEAMEYVFGYCCGNDVSARDWQKGTPGGQWLLGKTFDTFAPLGPYLVHKSVVPDPGKLRVQLRLNGETMQDSTTEQLIFSIPQVIAHITQVVTLRPGDVIYTGTPPGVGDARTPPVYLSAGDVCEVEIEGLGILRNECK